MDFLQHSMKYQVSTDLGAMVLNHLCLGQVYIECCGFLGLYFSGFDSFSGNGLWQLLFMGNTIERNGTNTSILVQIFGDSFLLDFALENPCLLWTPDFLHNNLLNSSVSLKLACGIVSLWCDTGVRNTFCLFKVLWATLCSFGFISSWFVCKFQEDLHHLTNVNTLAGFFFSMKFGSD